MYIACPRNFLYFQRHNDSCINDCCYWHDASQHLDLYSELGRPQNGNPCRKHRSRAGFNADTSHNRDGHSDKITKGGEMDNQGKKHFNDTHAAKGIASAVNDHGPDTVGNGIFGCTLRERFRTHKVLTKD